MGREEVEEGEGGGRGERGGKKGGRGKEKKICRSRVEEGDKGAGGGETYPPVRPLICTLPREDPIDCQFINY